MSNKSLMSIITCSYLKNTDRECIAGVLGKHRTIWISRRLQDGGDADNGTSLPSDRVPTNDIFFLLGICFFLVIASVLKPDLAQCHINDSCQMRADYGDVPSPDHFPLCGKCKPPFHGWSVTRYPSRFKLLLSCRCLCTYCRNHERVHLLSS